MQKRFLQYVTGCLILSGFFLEPSSYAAVVTKEVLSPQKITILAGSQSKMFSMPAVGSTGNGKLTLKNGDGSDLSPAVCSGKALQIAICKLGNALKQVEVALTRPKNLQVRLNGMSVLAGWTPEVGVFATSISLKDQNQLSVQFNGAPGTSITVSVSADFNVQPQPPPVPVLVLSAVQGFAPLTITVNAFSSTASSPITNYHWSFGDGSEASGAFATHVYALPGNFNLVLTVTDSAGQSSSKAQAIKVLQLQPPVAFLQVTSAATGVIPLMTSFDASGSTDPQGQTLTYSWDFGDGSTATSAQASHQFTVAGSYKVQLTVTNQSGASNKAETLITATLPEIPPADPKEQAPPLAAAEQTLFQDSVRFLASGTNPVQTNADLSQFEDRRLSVIRGKVFDDTGAPLSGVKVTILNHPEYGKTVTRADGQYDLLVNGGGYVTVMFEASGYLGSSRQVKTNFNDYFFTPDVVLAKLDTKVTRIVSGSLNAQVVVANPVADDSGARTPTIIIPPQTAAQIIMQDGSIRTVDSLSLRISEYTAGENGLKKMPANLPAGVAYTHAVEISADEAIAQGAKHVQFNRPVSYYVENFLNIPIGSGVPVGSLNPDTRLWEADFDGVVMKILSVEDGKAVLDLTGQGQPATQTELAKFNFSTEELTQIGTLYPPGKSLWRAQMSKFSAKDLNFFTGVFGNIANDPNVATSSKAPEVGVCPIAGSIIDLHRLTLKERISSPVLPFDLWYNSENAVVKVDDQTLRVNLSGASLPNDVTGIDYEIEIAGRKITGSALPEPNQRISYLWDGLDVYGRVVHEEIMAKITIIYKLRRYYQIPSEPSGKSWEATGGNLKATFISERDGSTLEKYAEMKIGAKQSGEKLGVNGWVPSILHSYNPITKRLTLGDGYSRDLDETYRTLSTIAGNGLPSGVNDGSAALGAPIGTPNSIAQSADGSIYFGDQQSARIRKISTDGLLSTYAGTSQGATSGDGGPATNAVFTSISKIVVAPDESVYVLDRTANRVRKISTDGIITTVAGTGRASISIQNNVPAKEASFNVISGIAVGRDGSLYLSDRGNNVIYKIGADGIVHWIAGTGVVGFSGNDGPALDATFNLPIVTDVGLNGDIYVADYGNSVIRVINPDGNVRAAVGLYQPGSAGLSADGTDALNALIGLPTDVKIAKTGEIYFIQAESVIKRVNSKGKLETLSSRLGSPIVEAGGIPGINPTGFFFANDGSLVMSDFTNNRIRRLGQIFVGNDPKLIQIPSEDGSEIFQFSNTGRHLRTLFARTGKTKWEFSYDERGSLNAITDADLKIVSINHGVSAFADSIVNKYGQVVNLLSNADGWLTGLRLPSGDAYQFTYSTKGLLASFTDPNGGTATFKFNSKGDLSEDTDAGGALKALQKVFFADGYVGSVTYPDGTKISASGRTINGAVLSSEITQKDGTKSTFTRAISSIQNSTTVGDITGFSQLFQNANPRLGGATTYNSGELYRFPDKSNTVARQVVLDRYNPNNLFDFKEREITTPDSGASPMVRTYDSATKLTTLLSAAGKVQYVRIDDQERPVTLQTGDLLPSQITYDNFGNVQKVQQGDRSTKFNYDANGNLLAIIDPLEREHKLVSDQVGRLTQSTSPAGEVIEFTYDKNGNLTGLRPFGKDIHQLVYDVVNLFSVYKPPTVGAESISTRYIYNSTHDLQKIIRADGQEIVYGYEASKGRVTSMTMGTQQIGFGYEDSAGNINAFTNSDNTNVTRISYAGSKQSNRSEIGLRSSPTNIISTSVSFTFNTFGQISSLNQFSNGNANFIINYAYDNDHLLKSAGALEIARVVETGLVSGTTLDGLHDEFTHNSYGEINGYASSTYSYSMTRDALGRIVKKSETTDAGTVVFDYLYDGNDRLAEVKKNGAVSAQYSYDGNGNRISAVIGGQTIASVFDAQDRLVTRGSTQYLFNAEGQLIQKTDGVNITKYQYDLMGQLKQVNLPDGKIISYDINGLGQRIAKKVNGVYQAFYQYQSGLQIVAQINPSGSIAANFVYGVDGHSPDYMVKEGARYRFVKDHLGSVRMVVNTVSGVVAQKIDYDEWGRVLSDSAPGFQPFGFAGGVWDQDTKLVRFGARDYDAETGRWTSKDPIIFGGRQSNLYSYVRSSPVNWIDPSGLVGEKRMIDPGSPDWTIYSATAGERLNAETQASADCFAECLGNTLIITGAKEGGHSPGSAHENGDACDFSDKKNPGLTTNPKAPACFGLCFSPESYGQIESVPPHLHFQIRPGKGGAVGFDPNKRR